MIGLVGISYKSAPIEIREKFTFTDDEILKFKKLISIDKDVKGLVVISTCNRTEIYYHIENKNSAESADFVFRNLSFFKDYDPNQQKHFYIKENIDAAEHLFKVVSGLDSLIFGEDQIIGQVKTAFKFSLDNNLPGSVLTRMFNKAFEAGKRVRTETTINQGAGSVSSAAVELCYTKFNALKSKSILLVGAGQTGELALLNFAKRKCKNIRVTNRTFEKAQAIAKKYDGEAFELNRLSEHLPQADIVLVATSSKTHLIDFNMVKLAQAVRTQKQVFIDLSVPRNISDDIKTIDNTELFAVDDLQEIVQQTSENREAAASDAMEIINTIKQEFADWMASLELTPTILKIKQSIQDVNLTELEGYIKINSVKETDLVQNYARHISSKYTRLFIRNLKNVTDNGKRKEYIKIVNDLFELA